MSAAMDLRPLHADMDLSETFDDDNIALLSPSNDGEDDNDKNNNSSRRSAPRSIRLGRKTPHRTNSKSTSTTKGSSSSSRRHSSTSILKSRSARSSSPNRESLMVGSEQNHISPPKPAKNSLRRAVTTESAKTPSTSRRLFKRRTSIDMVQNNSNPSGPCSASSSSQKPKVRCPATVSGIAKPSLMKKLKLEAKLRANRGTKLPLPSISGDSLHDEESSKNNNDNNLAKDDFFVGMDDTATTTSAPEEPSEGFYEDETECTYTADDGGFFQEENVVNLVRTVTDDEEDDGSIFAMQDFKDKDNNDNDNDNDDDNSEEGNGDSKHSNDNKLEKDDVTTSNATQNMSSEKDSDLPPLVEAEGSEEEGNEKDEGTEGIYKFESHWNAAFTVQSDHARGHLEDDGDHEKPQEMDTTVPVFCRGPQTAQGLLQFNHTTLDGLDLASCAGDDTSIFQMNSISTLDVPAIMTKELSALDKQLLQVQQLQTKTSKEKKSMFSGAIKKAKALKLKAAIGKGSKLLKDSTDHTSLSQSDDFNDRQESLLPTDQTGISTGDRNRGRSSSEDNPIEVVASSNDSMKDRETDERRDKATSVENDADLERKNSDPIDKDASRRRRDRLKGRRESVRDRSTDNNENDEERKERMRKRDALRKAACTMNVPSRTSSGNNATKTPRQGRRRVFKVGDTSKLDIDHSDEVTGGKDATADESKETGDHIRRRSAMQKAQSVHNTSTAITPRRVPVRRTASNDDGVGVGYASPHRTASGKVRRPSEAKFRRDKDEDRDRSRSREDIERSHDKRHRRPRRPKDSEGKEEDEMDKSRESVDVSKERRRGGERRQARRSRRNENGGDGMDKSAISIEDNGMNKSSSPGTGSTSSMRPERTVDPSVINLTGTGDILHSTFHTDLAPQPPPDRRQSFMKSLSVKREQARGTC